MLITSSAPGDGKSTIARYLAATAAASNVRVILVEADLRKPTLNSVLPDLRLAGLTDVLAGSASLFDVIQQVPVSAPNLRGSGASALPRTLDVILLGRYRQIPRICSSQIACST